MTPEEIQAAIKAAIDADRAAQVVEAERLKKEQERIEAEVTAKVDTAVKARMEIERRRLPIGGPAPHMTKFADTRPYDSVELADAAFAAEIMNQTKGGASNALLKAVAIKTAEDKTEIGAIGRETMKAIGLEPADALDAQKANELDYATQSGFGSDFVPTVWSSQIWLRVRAMTFVAAKLPSKAFTGPGNTFTLPIEGADPTWYRIGETTDLNATTGRPDATIGDSKLATANNSVTFAKMGARVPYSGELVEDSIVDWAGQLRYQLEKSFAEQFEHAIIDGDTATGGSTNINNIAGTPTSTGTKQDLYLTVNGLRKSPLVTTTSNSRSASGGLVDSDFLETLFLMGTAGLQGFDPSKVDFIVDPNTSKKVTQLAVVKTRDIFEQATIENGWLKGIWGYNVYTSFFMHFKSTTNARKANTSGKVDTNTQANNTTGAILAVRWDQWYLGYKRMMALKLQDIPDSDAQQVIATARFGLIQRDTEGSAITYNVGV